MINPAELPAEAKTHCDQPQKGKKKNIRNKKKKKIHEVHTTHLLDHLLSCSSYIRELQVPSDFKGQYWNCLETTAAASLKLCLCFFWLAIYSQNDVLISLKVLKSCAF
jgi:hypothetical protein